MRRAGWSAALLVCIGMLLGGCEKSPLPTPPDPGPSDPIRPYNADTANVVQVATVMGVTIYRFCDGRNLVYITNGSPRMLSVVGDAQECTG